MSINKPYRSPQEMPASLPVFPLSGALLLPRGQIPLNIFEPRYIALVDAAMSHHRLIGLVQPSGEGDNPPLQSIGCAGRITQLSETGDERYMLTLSGVARFRIVEEMPAITPFRTCQVSFDEFADDFMPRHGEELVDRDGVLRALKDFAKSNKLKVDWDSIHDAPNEALVNALAMMSPFGPKEKQALLEAGDLRLRAEVLIAITEMESARSSGASNSLQ